MGQREPQYSATDSPDEKETLVGADSADDIIGLLLHLMNKLVKNNQDTLKTARS
jgi:hypothetical protein